jgi:L-rhamnose 1-dehydrogenase
MSSIVFPLLKGKSAIVTGGTTGIGRGIVLEYLRQGCNVVVNHLGLQQDEVHRSGLVEEAKKIRSELEAQGQGHISGQLYDVVGDIAKPADCLSLVQKTTERFGKLDIFVANAGIFKPAAFLE